MATIRERFGRWEKAALGLVAFLVVIPAVVNAIGDIWVSVQGLPIGEKEKINAVLFKKHFKENPEASEQIEIEGDLGTLAISIDVYNNGDIFVDYGKFTQWFPFNYKKDGVVSFSIFGTAHAWTFKNRLKSVKKNLNVVTKSVKHNVISNTEIERVRTLSDGSVEKQRININTGEVLHVESIINTKNNVSALKKLNAYSTIDVRTNRND